MSIIIEQHEINNSNGIKIIASRYPTLLDQINLIDNTKITLPVTYLLYVSVPICSIMQNNKNVFYYIRS